MYLTTVRLVLINMKGGKWDSFDIPLAYMYKEKFNQPIFGANFLSGSTAPLFNMIPGPAHFKAWFMKGGCGKFLRSFHFVVEKLREHQRKGLVSEKYQSQMGGTFQSEQIAFLDPNDPSHVFISQPPVGAPQDHYMNRHLNEILPGMGGGHPPPNPGMGGGGYMQPSYPNPPMAQPGMYPPQAAPPMGHPPMGQPGMYPPPQRPMGGVQGMVGQGMYRGPGGGMHQNPINQPMPMHMGGPPPPQPTYTPQAAPPPMELDPCPEPLPAQAYPPPPGGQGGGPALVISANPSGPQGGAYPPAAPYNPYPPQPGDPNHIY